VTDFCLSARTLRLIARQTELMDRMGTYLGVTPDGYTRGVGDTLWCEARFRCIACKWSGCCAAFLAAPAPVAPRAPTFCANRDFFHACTRTSRSTTIPLGGSP
jgi:hypothetical protein